MPKPIVFVAGHQRPDTDACVSAYVCAALKQRLDPSRIYQPIIQGDANRQTQWLFSQAGAKLPPVRRDVRRTVGEVMQTTVRSVRETAHLGDALQLMREAQLSMVPVVDASGKLQGILSMRLPQNQYFYNFNAEDTLGRILTLVDVIDALDLVQLAGKGIKNEPKPGRFRVASHSPDQLKWRLAKGDVILTGPDKDSLKTAEEASVQAVILADCDLARARKLTAATPHVPIYWYRGSLMALISELPMAIPVKHVMGKEFPVLYPHQIVESLRELLAQITYTLPVIDENRNVVGVFSRSQALQQQTRQIILVDHFEREQSVAGLQEVEILEVIDHHRVGGNISTMQPIRLDCRPIGSTASILALQYRENNITPNRQQAMLLLGALLSDTLLLTSPTTTAIDKEIAADLAKRARVRLQQFGRQILTLNDELTHGEPSRLVEKDLKEFQHGPVRFSVSQLETVDLKLLTEERRDALAEALIHHRGPTGPAFAVLMITDVFRGTSHVMLSDTLRHRAQWLLECDTPEEGKLFNGVVSRKKQLLPLLLDRLNNFPG